MKNKLAPSVSVIMPVYNVEKYIKRAVDSVLTQSFQNFELILCDDGSTDSSGKLCDEFAKCDSRIKVLHDENRGVGAARNRGFYIAEGKYIYFMDPDDCIDKNLLKDNVEIAEQYGCDQVIFGFVCEICGKNDACIKRIVYLHNLSGFYTYDDFKRDYITYLKNVPQTVWNRIYRKSSIDGVVFSELHTAEDAIFNLDVLKKELFGVYYNNKAYYTYYNREKSLMNSYNIEKFNNEIYITDRIWELIDKWNRHDEFDKYISLSYVQSIIGEYNNLTLPDCPMSLREGAERIKNIFSDQRITNALKLIDSRDIPGICSRVCFILSKQGRFYLALVIKKFYTPASRFLNRLITRFITRFSEK